MEFVCNVFLFSSKSIASPGYLTLVDCLRFMCFTR